MGTRLPTAKKGMTDRVFKAYVSKFIRSTLVGCMLCSTPLFPDEADDLLAVVKANYNENNDDGYVINFTDVSIIEYIRFVSKVIGVNFIFNDDELSFKTTIVSEEPISAKNVLSTLIQVLRVNDLRILEQNSNLIITKNETVKQIPEIVTDSSDQKTSRAAIVTRIFRINNVSPTLLVSILEPMLSPQALIKVMPGSSLLIVSDVVSNVDKIASLLVTLDTSHSPLEVDTYECQNFGPTKLIELAAQILAPFTEGTPFLLIPQSETNSIFIVATTSLIERALTVIEDLDAIKKEPISQEGLGEKVFIYKILNRSPEFLLSSLRQIAQELIDSKSPSRYLIQSLESVKWIRDSNSLMFLAAPQNIDQIKTILASMDTAGVKTGPASFYIFHLNDASPDKVQAWINEMADTLSQSPHPDQGLISALRSNQLIKETNSLIFTGNEQALSRIKEILASTDFKTKIQTQTASNFWMYTPKFSSGEEILAQLQELEENLKDSRLSDPSLIKMLDTVKWVPKSKALVFTGTPEAIEKIKPIVAEIDQTGKAPIKESVEAANQFWMYKPEHRSGEEIVSHVNEIAQNLEDSGLANPSFLKTLETMRWVPKTNSLIFTGDADSLERIKPIVKSIDETGKADVKPEVPSSTDSKKTSFFIYKPISKTPQDIEKSLTAIANDLKLSGLADPMLLQTIASMRLVDTTDSLLFTGTSDSLDKVKGLIERIDIPSAKGPSIQQVGTQTFLIYKLQFVNPEKVIASLKAIANDLEAGDHPDQNLMNTIRNVKTIKETNSLLFMGPEKTLIQVEGLAKKFDVPSFQAKDEKPEIAPEDREAPSNFVLYVPKYVAGQELITMVVEFKQHLMQTGVVDKELFDTISHLKWIAKTNSILISGSAAAIARVEELLTRFDLPTKDGEPLPPTIQTLETTSFLVYKLQYHNGSSIQEALKKVAIELSKTNSDSNKQILDAINSIQWIEVTNSLIGTGHQTALGKVKELIRNLDTPLKQVFIEVLILETRLTNTQDFGLQWGSKFKYLDKFAGATGNFPPSTGSIGPGRASNFNLGAVNATRFPSPDDVPFAPEGFDLGIIGDIILHKGNTFISLGSLVSALQQDTDTVIIMNPKIITQDNKNSTIFVGNNIPFVGSQVSNQSSNVVLTTSLEYRDLGLNLSITPTLSTSEIVTLDIMVDITEQTFPSTNFGTSGVQGINSSHTSMSTRVTVPNRHFLALSGMLQDTKSHARAQIPCLGGLPVIGAAFSQNQRTDAKANILIFLKPVIINTFEEYRELTENQEILLKEESGPEIIKEELEAGLEWVKCPEDDD